MTETFSFSDGRDSRKLTTRPTLRTPRSRSDMPFGRTTQCWSCKILKSVIEFSFVYIYVYQVDIICLLYICISTRSLLFVNKNTNPQPGSTTSCSMQTRRPSDLGWTLTLIWLQRNLPPGICIFICICETLFWPIPNEQVQRVSQETPQQPWAMEPLEPG